MPDYNKMMKDPILALFATLYVYNLLENVPEITPSNSALVNVQGRPLKNADGSLSNEQVITFTLNVHEQYRKAVKDSLKNSGLRVEEKEGALFISGREFDFENFKNSLPKSANRSMYNQPNLSKEKQVILLERINGTISNPPNLTAKPNSWV
jgi:flagellar biosynthesis/type III secretory pathway M-ring protein FliF/YscJ